MAENKRICSVEGCNKPAKARGWCFRHYAKWKNHGDPRAGREDEDGSGLQLLKGLTRYSYDKCFIWPYGRTSRGYGQVWLNGKCVSAHRLMCALVHGPQPFDEALVAHSCDNPSCVNPNHLRWATHAENMESKKERDRAARGESHGCAILSKNQARFVFSQKGKTSRRQLAMMMGVSRHTISDIHRKASWRHIHDC